MRILDRVLDGVMLLEPTVLEDDRGSFYESFNRRTFRELTGFRGEFVQDNHSTSRFGVLRGVHYQLPRPQGKLVRCIKGRVWDVAVDLRRSSASFGRWHGYELNQANRYQLWLPEGFGHGFIALTSTAEVLYRTTDFWDADSDRAIRWDDRTLDISWPMEGNPVLSDRDRTAPGLDDALLFD